jgi:CRP/FNR family cyclic AMP-dependent transcriptional regulator
MGGIMGISIAVDLRSAGAKAMQAPAPRPWPNNTRIKTKLAEKQAFDVQVFLDPAGVRRRVVEYGSKETVFTQGDPATSVLYIQKGGVKLSVVNEAGKEAVVAILGPGDFFGEACLAGQPQRVRTAATITPSTILVIEKPEMIRLLHAERALFDQFIKHVLSRNIQVEEDLIDQLFNSSEKRLARALLLLARYREQGRPQEMLPEVSQEMLAEMIGTTRSRVNSFMNKFRKLGFIEYGGRLRGLQINQSLLIVVGCEGSKQEAPAHVGCGGVRAMALERN